ncbi:MAG: hypothetical protein LAN83_10115 [Acidobacteriia bacterium]|nr:hypothetical protein [Terriglobia bacterium]
MSRQREASQNRICLAVVQPLAADPSAVCGDKTLEALAVISARSGRGGVRPGGGPTELASDLVEFPA